VTQSDLGRLRARLPANPGIMRRAGTSDFVVFVPLVLVQGEYHFLFEKRAPAIRQGGEVSFPGGSFEPEVDGSKEEAALRETVEELGVRKERLTVLGRLDAVVTHTGGIIDPFVGTIDSAHDYAPNPSEVAAVFFTPVSFFARTEPERYQIRREMQPFSLEEDGSRRVTFPARELGLPERYWQAWSGGSHTVCLFRYAGEVIWGITAEIVLSVVGLLGK